MRFFFRIFFFGVIVLKPLYAQRIPTGEYSTYKLSYLSLSAASVSFQVERIFLLSNNLILLIKQI